MECEITLSKLGMKERNDLLLVLLLNREVCRQLKKFRFAIKDWSIYLCEQEWQGLVAIPLGPQQADLLAYECLIAPLIDKNKTTYHKDYYISEHWFDTNTVCTTESLPTAAVSFPGTSASYPKRLYAIFR